MSQVEIISLNANNGESNKLTIQHNKQEQEQQQQQKYEQHRECVLCSLKIIQENLYAHYCSHYYEYPRCKFCDKLQNNPSSFVTHLATHTDAQYQCFKCNKWFKLVITYKKHLRECDETNNNSGNDTCINQVSHLNIKDLISFGTHKIKIKSNFNRKDAIDVKPSTSRQNLKQVTPIKTFQSREISPLLNESDNDSPYQTRSKNPRRTYRLTAPTLVSQFNELKPGIQHNKTGFEDLAFVGFSCDDFSQIAQYYCEIYPRKVNSLMQNSFNCPHCEYSFPCETSLKLHLESSNKFSCKFLMNSQSNFECVKQTLNNIITVIETKENVTETQEAFLNSVGLVSINTHKKAINSKLEKKVQLRKELGKINYNYINTLNNYKQIYLPHYIDPLRATTSKVNLIRCKKLKKNQIKQPKIVYSNSNEIKRISSLNTIIQPKQIRNTNIKFTMTSGSFSGSHVDKPLKRKLPEPIQALNLDTIKRPKQSIETSSIDSQISTSSKKAPPKLHKVPVSAIKESIQMSQPKLMPKLLNIKKETSIQTKIENVKPIVNSIQQQQQQQVKQLKTSNRTINEETENCLAKCKLCAKIFNSKNEILEHIVQSHQKMVRMVIDRYCPIQETQKQLLNNCEKTLLNSF